jgi:hypothetical protein
MPSSSRRNSIDIAPVAYTIAEFCRAHRISPAKFFDLKARGQGPTEMHVGRRVLISTESAAAWRAQREALAAADTISTKAVTDARADTADAT